MKLKNLGLLVLTFCLFYLGVQQGYSQFKPVKKYDYSQLENKVLYIPTFEGSSKFISKMKRRGKYAKIKDVNRKAAIYNKAWNEAMAESSYDATDYKITAYDKKKLIKSKDEKAILLQLFRDEYGNKYASLMVTSPKERVIARTLITGFDLSDKNDVRLMMNMLNESLTMACELYDEDEKKISGKKFRNKYKESFLDFCDELEDKTFLVPRVRHKNPKKAASKNADLRAALKEWKISDYEFTTTANIKAKRIEGDANSYYWRSIPYYTNNKLTVYNINFILSTDSDDVIIYFMGTKKLKPSTLQKIQKTITNKAEKYRKQLDR